MILRCFLAAALACNLILQEQPRELFSSSADGKGPPQWVVENGNQKIYYFFKVRPNDSKYERRTYLIYANDPNKRIYTVMDNGTIIGRWDNRGYAQPPERWRGRKTSWHEIPERVWPRPTEKPTLPGSPDNYPRTQPPPSPLGNNN